MSRVVKNMKNCCCLLRNIVILQAEMNTRIIMMYAAATILTGCSGQFNKVYKYSDLDYRYEYAKQCFAEGSYSHAEDLLHDLITVKKGGDEAQESLYMLGMSEYLNRDYQSASETFKKYYKTYPKGLYAEQAAFYIGQALYQDAPEPRLDQSPTNGAITAYQDFLDIFPNSPLREEATKRLYELYDKLTMKELLSAQLYFNLGGYFGNVNSSSESNYTSCIVVAQNALKTFPYTDLREDFAVLIMRSKFELAENSSEEKKLDRYRDAEDECYGFINEYPDSKMRSTAEKYIAKCRKITKD